ncbi:MAG: radical SAM protein [Candidatus Zixiibacteriota bacterium]
MEKLKASRYNHFVDMEDGTKLAFNALSCGLAEMDKDSYERYKDLADGNGHSTEDETDDLLQNLKKGGFLIPEDLDELDVLRAAHYQARFGNNGFGLTIVPTLNCNFACDYCYESKEIHSLPPDKGGFMSDEVCDNIVKLCEKRIPENSAFSVTWYGGEPMLAKSIIDRLSREFIRICESKKSVYHAGMITNGYLLTKENIQFLIESKVTFLQVTVDGPREVHDKRRPLKSGGGTYDRIMGNLEKMAIKSLISVSIRINIDNRNSNCFKSLLSNLKAAGLDKKNNISFYFGHVVQYNKSCQDISAHCLLTEQYSKFVIKANKYAINNGLKLSTLPRIMISSCGAIAPNSLVIEPSGRIQNCWNTIGNENIKTGQLTPKGINVTDKYVKWLGWNPFNNKCTDCTILPMCMGGCPYISIYRENQDNAENIICSSWKYNLRPMLGVIKSAKEKDLIIKQN